MSGQGDTDSLYRDARVEVQRLRDENAKLRRKLYESPASRVPDEPRAELDPDWRERMQSALDVIDVVGAGMKVRADLFRSEGRALTPEALDKWSGAIGIGVEKIRAILALPPLPKVKP